jgi:hypothetical protein
MAVYVLFFFVSESLLNISKAVYSCFLTIDSFSIPEWLLLLRFDAPVLLSPLQTVHAVLLTTFTFTPTSQSCPLFEVSWTCIFSSTCLPSFASSLLQPSSPTFLSALFLLATLALDAPPFFWVSGAQASET